MAERRITLQTAAFLDSEEARLLGARVQRKDAREILHRFLDCAYVALGKAPHQLDEADLSQVLRDLLPRHYGRRDPLAPHTGPVLRSFLSWLEGETVVPSAWELRAALEDGVARFEEAVARGAGDPTAVAPTKTIVHRGDKVGRNDPCPCGSGKKFKRCCAELGGEAP